MSLIEPQSSLIKCVKPPLLRGMQSLLCKARRIMIRHENNMAFAAGESGGMAFVA
jgi:hypothetical protein